MNKISLLVTILLSSSSLFGQESKGVAIDSSYKNWYYDARANLYSKLEKKKVDIVFFGNSITEHGPWHELVGFKYRIGNRGIGGDNTFGMKARILNAISSKPKKIFLMMGINDVGRGLPTAVTAKNYEDIILIIKKYSPNTKIYIQSTLPMNESLLKYDYLKGKEALVRAQNETLEKLSAKYKLTYVNVKEVLADDYNLKSTFTTDGIHLNADGYIVWANYLKKKKYI